MKKNNYLILIIFSILFFIIMLNKNKNQYYYIANYKAICSSDIRGINKYYHLLPVDTFIISEKNKSISIKSIIKNKDIETIKKKSVEIDNLSKKILKNVNDELTECVGYKNPTIYKTSEEILDTNKHFKIKIILFILNFLLTLFFISKLGKINVEKLYH